ncbi:MAG: hypothetical protein MI919_37530, partial [Holophagales bacterium]|nr:hypothetical protein [Holophagales bacterium]
MSTLEVVVPESTDYSVLICKSSCQTYWVICAAWPCVSPLPTTVTFGGIFAYASVSQQGLEDCLRADPSLFSQPLSAGTAYAFDGTAIVGIGSIKDPGYSYSLTNRGLAIGPLTCGLAQEVDVNGEQGTVPVCVLQMEVGMTAYFPRNDLFYIGLGKLAGVSEAQGLFLNETL